MHVDDTAKLIQGVSIPGGRDAISYSFREKMRPGPGTIKKTVRSG